MKLRELLFEREISRFVQDINLKIDILLQSTVHSEERGSERTITDDEIKATAQKATQRILQGFFDGKIQNAVPFRIFDPAHDINLIAKLTLNVKGTPEYLTVITAIKKKDFIARNAQTIKV